MTFPPMGEYPPPAGPPRRSPWSSPLVLVSIVAGVFLVVAAVLAALLLLPKDDKTTPAATPTSTVTVTATPSATPPTTTIAAPPPTSTVVIPRPAPSVSGADWQGFLAGPRCNAADDPAIAIGRTTQSRVVICQVGAQSGRWYYKGQAASGSIEIGYPQRTVDGFTVTNAGTTYTVNAQALRIITNGTVVASEPMIEFWTR